jgi:mono/diheme cytochrome c family protein
MKTLRTALLCLLATGCTYYENEPVKPPVQEKSDPTTTLEAKYVTDAPNKVTASYWKTADYLPLVEQNQVTGQVQAADGLFNMSGTFGGLTSFGEGKDPDVRLQAAYTDDSLYVLVTWKDTTAEASHSNWIYDGPSDPNKAGSTAGWTSQRANDNFLLSFDMGSGQRDVWNWSLALSEPMGYAIDMIDNGSGATNDAGTLMYVRNAVSDNRGGPQYEWNDVQQQLTRKPAGSTILDPGYFLLNKKTFTGDIVAGEAYYQLECAPCHGPTGNGEGTPAGYETGIKVNEPGQFNRWTRAALDEFLPSVNHEGAVHYPAGETDRANLFARLRGFSGIPGYYLQNPSGSSADIHAVSSAVIANLPEYNSKKYTVLLVRALSTGQTDDITLNPATVTYSFNFSVRDNDLINQIGTSNQTLTFKPKP